MNPLDVLTLVVMLGVLASLLTSIAKLIEAIAKLIESISLLIATKKRKPIKSKTKGKR
ncbi:hypothetical protein [Streptococcus minor]|uniref:hypothetical protein n=1 Tax=Streptococcus minor TaxID=229549 RepID=UPI0012EAAF6F|nr:hypothetical protein [Streptococcus minor]